MILKAAFLVIFGFSLPLQVEENVRFNEKEVKLDIPLTIVSGIEVDKENVYVSTDAGLFVIPKVGSPPMYLGPFQGIAPPWLTGMALWEDDLYLSTDREGIIRFKKGEWKPEFDVRLAWKTALFECEANEKWLLVTGKPREANYTYLIPRKEQGEVMLVPTLFGKEKCTLMGDTVLCYSPEGRYLRIFVPDLDSTWTIPLELKSKNPRPGVNKLAYFQDALWVLLAVDALYRIETPGTSPREESIELPENQRIWDFALTDDSIALATDSGVFWGKSGSWILLEKVPNVKKVAVFEDEVWFANEKVVGRAGSGKPLEMSSLVKDPRIDLIGGSGFVHLYLSGPFYGDGGIRASIPYLKKRFEPGRFRFYYGVLGVGDSAIPLVSNVKEMRFGKFTNENTLEPGLVIPGKDFLHPVVLGNTIWGVGKTSFLFFNRDSMKWDSLKFDSIEQIGDESPFLAGLLGDQLLVGMRGDLFSLDPLKGEMMRIPIPSRDTLLSIPIASSKEKALVGGLGRMDLVDTSKAVLGEYLGDPTLYYEPLLLMDQYALVEVKMHSLERTIPMGVYVLGLQNGDLRRIQKGALLLSDRLSGVEINGDTLWMATRSGVSHFPLSLLFKEGRK